MNSEPTKEELEKSVRQVGCFLLVVFIAVIPFAVVMTMRDLTILAAALKILGH